MTEPSDRFKPRSSRSEKSHGATKPANQAKKQALKARTQTLCRAVLRKNTTSDSHTVSWRGREESPRPPHTLQQSTTSSRRPFDLRSLPSQSSASTSSSTLSAWPNNLLSVSHLPRCFRKNNQSGSLLLLLDTKHFLKILSPTTWPSPTHPRRPRGRHVLPPTLTTTNATRRARVNTLHAHEQTNEPSLCWRSNERTQHRSLAVGVFVVHQRTTTNEATD